MTYFPKLSRVVASLLAVAACLTFAARADAGLFISITTTGAGTVPSSGSLTPPLATAGSETLNVTSFGTTDLTGTVSANAQANVGNDLLNTVISLNHTGSTAETVTISVTETFSSALFGTLTASNAFTNFLGVNSVIAKINGTVITTGPAQAYSSGGPNYVFTQVFKVQIPGNVEVPSLPSIVSDVVTLNGAGTHVPEPGSILVWSVIACAIGSQRLMRRKQTAKD